MTAAERHSAFHFDPADWLPLPAAARALGVSQRTVRNRCQQWVNEGLACQRPGPGGQVGWWIARRADPALQVAAADGSTADQRLVEVPEITDRMAQLSERQRRLIAAKQWAIGAFDTAQRRERRPVSQWLPMLLERLNHEHGERRKIDTNAPKLRFTRDALYRWRRELRKAGGDLTALADTRGGDQKSQGDRRAWQHFTDHFLDQRRPTKRDCWERTRDYARANDLAWCSYSSLLRQLDDRIAPATQVYHRDPARWRSEYAPYTQQDAERFAAGECWVGDHRPMDLLCRITTPEGTERIFRPQLTLWLDWRTRRVVGWMLSDLPDSSTILASLRMGLLDPANKGGPSQVWIDNGRDFVAYTFHGQTAQARRTTGRVELDELPARGLFARAGITPHFSLKFNPQGKARCERFFATLAWRFDKTFATYTGKDTVNKPENLQQIIKAARHIPSFEHVRKRLAGFIAGYNARSEHQIHDLAGPDGRLSPDQAMDQWNTTRRLRPADEVLDAMLQQHHKPVRVGRNGFTLRIAGQPMRFGQAQLMAELRPYQNTKRDILVTYDPADLRTVRVHDDQWRFICEATANQVGPRHADPLRIEHVKQAARIKAQNKKAHEAMRQTYDAELLSAEEIAADAAAAEADSATRPPVRADGLKLVRNAQPAHEPARPDTPDAEPAAKVAGAEHDQLPSIFDDMPDDWSAGLYPPDELDDGPSILDFASDTDVQAEDSRSIVEDL